MAIVEIKLNGLKGNKKGRDAYEAGDVVKRKYGREWHIYIPVDSTLSHETLIRRANNDQIFADTVLGDILTKAAKPSTTINDKIDNSRPNISTIYITVNTETRQILDYRLEGAMRPVKEIKEEAIIIKKTMYNELEHFGAF